jgi:H+/Cl- antiporter ClcA
MTVQDGAAGPQVDPTDLLRSRRYTRLLVLAALIGVPISAAAYGFLQLVSFLQRVVFTYLPQGLGYADAPTWWPLPVLTVAGLLVGLTIRYLPGRGGHVPAYGLHVGGPPTAAELPGVVLAAIAGLSLGVVLGPEAPLIALGGGLAALAVRSPRIDARAAAIIGAAGSFAAISVLFGSPLVGAFLLMEVIGLGGPMMGVVLLPGLLASGVGALIFVGLDNWTGEGRAGLAVLELPSVGSPTGTGFAWALVIGVAGGLLGSGIRRLSRPLSALAQARIVYSGPIAGVLVGGIAALYAVASGHSINDVLFSGQDALPGLLQNPGAYTAAALVGLVLAKGVAYVLCLATLRGGPVFPALYLGAAGGLAVAHLPGLPAVTGAALGIGAMVVAMLRLPLTSVLLASLLFGHDSATLMPLVIVTVVVAHVVAAVAGPRTHGESSTSVSVGSGTGSSGETAGKS